MIQKNENNTTNLTTKVPNSSFSPKQLQPPNSLHPRRPRYTPWPKISHYPSPIPLLSCPDAPSRDSPPGAALAPRPPPPASPPHAGRCRPAARARCPRGSGPTLASRRAGRRPRPRRAGGSTAGRSSRPAAWTPHARRGRRPGSQRPAARTPGGQGTGAQGPGGAGSAPRFPGRWGQAAGRKGRAAGRKEKKTARARSSEPR